MRAMQVPDVGEFMRQHSMQCPMALQRLVVVGLPATVTLQSRVVLNRWPPDV